MKLLIEIRPGEGGDDAKLLVQKQASLFIRTAEQAGIPADLVDVAYGAVG